VLEKDSQVVLSNTCAVRLLWMDDESLVSGRSFYIKLGTKVVPATVMNIRYKVDINTGEHIPVDQVYKNEIVYCDISLPEKCVVDKFTKHRSLGSFVLIDRVTNMTSACGVIRHSMRRSDNLTWHQMDITRQFRAGRLEQNPITIWFTGLSGAGKSTLANALEKRLNEMGHYTMLLDGDNVRLGLNKDLGFKDRDRVENIRRVAEVARLMNDAGLIVLASFISPYQADRENARDIVGADSFLEVYVSTSLEECERRDVKHLYAKARKGEIPNFTGISSPYEEPQHPDVVVDTANRSIDEVVDAVLEQLGGRLRIRS
jgi:bifunctional enzyme CysN/CysC